MCNIKFLYFCCISHYFNFNLSLSHTPNLSSSHYAIARIPSIKFTYHTIMPTHSPQVGILQTECVCFVLQLILCYFVLRIRHILNERQKYHPSVYLVGVTAQLAQLAHTPSLSSTRLAALSQPGSQLHPLCAPRSHLRTLTQLRTLEPTHPSSSLPLSLSLSLFLSLSIFHQVGLHGHLTMLGNPNIAHSLWRIS